MKFDNPGMILAKLVAVGMLFVALVPHPYSYYKLLRWVVCGVTTLEAIRASGSRKVGWIFPPATVAIVFNPILPLQFTRETWSVIDIVTAVCLVISIFVVDGRSSG